MAVSEPCTADQCLDTEGMCGCFLFVFVGSGMFLGGAAATGAHPTGRGRDQGTDGTRPHIAQCTATPGDDAAADAAAAEDDAAAMAQAEVRDLPAPPCHGLVPVACMQQI
ncbi:hypothetical protein C8F04DRAFT_1178343 [Mycena alexandri]|uniref:Uncharacterized protein n=1 Tax=Mycena alexandri TaxID=1745969 RepID=A0AAD6T571_9AGAR|nr:hypothetical protein C8F04DRAFT_1178343 [Mycena alexandri]